MTMKGKRLLRRAMLLLLAVLLFGAAAVCAEAPAEEGAEAMTAPAESEPAIDAAAEAPQAAPDADAADPIAAEEAAPEEKIPADQTDAEEAPALKAAPEEPAEETAAQAVSESEPTEAEEGAAAPETAPETETEEAPREEAEALREAIPFTAAVTIQQRESVLVEGGRVRLTARVEDASMAYALRWEYRLPKPEDAREEEEMPWVFLQEEAQLELDISWDNARIEYRVRLIAEDGQTVESAVYQMKDIQPAPEEEEETNTEEAANTEEDLNTEEAADTEEETDAEEAAEAEEELDAEEAADGEEDPAGEEEVEIEDYDTPLGLSDPEAADADSAAPVMKVTVYSSNQGVARAGDTVLLTSSIEGFEGYEILYQWECDRGDGFQPVEGANEDFYAFTVTEETIGWDWQLKVYYR